MTKFTALVLTGFLFVSQYIIADENDYRFKEDIEYGVAVNDKGEEEILLMDLYQPPGKETKKPVIILVHGGGFSSGDKQLELYKDMAAGFAKAGYVAFSVNYRLRTGGYNQKVLESAVEDVLTALAFIRAHAEEYGIDTNKIMIGGDSAGAAASVHTAYKNPEASGFIACFDLWGGQSIYTESVDDGPAWDQAIHPSPIPVNAPPTCIIQGSADVTVPQQLSEDFAQQLNDAGIYHELNILEGAGHYATDRIDDILEIMLDFAGKVTAEEISVVDFGAVAGDDKLDTKAFQNAIDFCHSTEGLKVIVPAGEYYSGTVELKSDVELHFEDGSFLFGSQKISDYRTDIETAVEIPSSSASLIYASNAVNIKISGKGVIDVRGDTLSFPYADSTGKHSVRPMGLRFIKCNNIEISGISLKNAAAWMSHYVQCKDVKIHGINIHNRVNHNNDGIDLDNCKNVEIWDSEISAGDDAICLKSTQGTANENIHVHNCRLSSRWGCIKTGTSSSAGFKNITVENCEFHDCEGIAIKLLCVDGGVMEDIRISNIKMKNVTGPIFIRLGGRYRSYNDAAEMAYDKTEAEGEGRSIIRNVIIENIEAEVITEDLLISNIMISGYTGHDIENVTLNNISIEYPGGGKQEYASIEVPENIASYPEMSFFGMLPAGGMYLRHIDGLRINDMEISFRSEDARPVIVAEDVKDMKLKGLSLSGVKNNKKLFDFSGSEKKEIKIKKLKHD